MRHINRDDYGLGYDQGFQDGRADGWTEAMEEAERVYEKRIQKLYAEILEMNARVDRIEKIMDERGL